MNKQGKSSVLTGFLVIGAIVALLLLGVMAYGSYQNSVRGSDPVSQSTSNVAGKAATLSVYAEDQAADDTSTKRAVPVYVQNPNGEWIVTGGSITSASGASTITSGISVQGKDKPYKLAAFNNTYGSLNGLQDVAITDETPVATVPVYSIGGTITLTLYDENDVALPTTTANVSLSASETYTFSKLRVKNTGVNTAHRLYGIYMDLDANTNISSVSINDGKVDAKGSMSLQRTTADDYAWKLKSPTILYEYDVLDVQGISVQADGDGTNGEQYTLYTVDGEYFFSSKGKGVQFGPETDATSPIDVGAADDSITGYLL